MRMNVCIFSTKTIILQKYSLIELEIISKYGTYHAVKKYTSHERCVVYYHYELKFMIASKISKLIPKCIFSPFTQKQLDRRLNTRNVNGISRFSI